jgi:LacI family transcriptional regulator
MLKEKSIDALIIWGANRMDKCCDELYKEPVIFMNTKPFTDKKYSYVGHDNYGASYGITEYVLNKGRKKFIYLQGSQVNSICIERKKGFLDALKKHKISIPENYIFESAYDKKSAYVIMDKVFKDKSLEFDAIIATTDIMALGAYEAALKNGKKIPEDFSLAGGGGVSIFGEKDYPITTYKIDCFTMGKNAVAQIISAIDNNAPKEFYQQLKTKLVKGKTA